MSEQTPMMRQYLEIKSRHPDAILFFRMGDFYEMFLEDAVTASGILDIALTSRNRGAPDETAMCGVPYHSSSPYIAKLVEAGYKVAVCEQLEDPRTTKGIVKRDVVRVVTPGLVVESESLVPDENTFLFSVHRKSEDEWGCAWLDLSTGEFRASEQASFQGVCADMAAVNPREILVRDSGDDDSLADRIRDSFRNRTVSKLAAWVYDAEYLSGLLCSQFGVISPAALGLADMPLALVASGAAMHYLRENRTQSLRHIRPVSVFRKSDQLVLDEATRRNLEIVATMSEGKKHGSLLWCLDRTGTAMGARRIRQWLGSPLVSAPDIRRRLDGVQELHERSSLRLELTALLKSVNDLERINGRIGMASAGARDLRALHESLAVIPAIRDALSGFSAAILAECLAAMDPLEDIRERINVAIAESPPFSVREGGIIRDGYSAELDELRAISREGKGFIARMEAEERSRTGISSLKIRYNKVFGYYIEITRTNLAAVPEEYIRRQTLANAERFVTQKLKEYEEKVLGAEDMIHDLEHSLFQEVRDLAAAASGRVTGTADAIAVLDVLNSFANVSADRNYCRPEVDEGDVIEIEEGRHPVIEAMNLGERFVPNDVRLDLEENQILMITGPNMAGKSTYMRQVALITLLSQTGCFVPASKARIGIVDRIFTRVGAGDNLARGQSTFMLEMMETASILKNATSRSLIVMDEIGRGTSTFDGVSIAWAVAEFIHDSESCRARTLFATHYHELTELASTCGRIANFTVAVREWNDQVIFLRTIIPGGASHSYGIQVARLAGMPQEVIERAREILRNLESGEFEDGVPRLAKSSMKPKQPQSPQISLFESGEDLLRQRLRKVSINNITPLEAINLLDDLKKML